MIKKNQSCSVEMFNLFCLNRRTSGPEVLKNWFFIFFIYRSYIKNMYISFTINIISNIFVYTWKTFSHKLLHIYKKKPEDLFVTIAIFRLLLFSLLLLLISLLFLFFDKFALMDSLDTIVLTNARILATDVTT